MKYNAVGKSFVKLHRLRTVHKVIVISWIVGWKTGELGSASWLVSKLILNMVLIALKSGYTAFMVCSFCFFHGISGDHCWAQPVSHVCIYTLHPGPWKPQSFIRSKPQILPSDGASWGEERRAGQAQSCAPCIACCLELRGRSGPKIPLEGTLPWTGLRRRRRR